MLVTEEQVSKDYTYAYNLLLKSEGLPISGGSSPYCHQLRKKS